MADEKRVPDSVGLSDLQRKYDLLQEMIALEMTLQKEQRAELQAENAALREIVEAVANAEYYSILVRGVPGVMPEGKLLQIIINSTTNIVEKARALLGIEHGE